MPQPAPQTLATYNLLHDGYRQQGWPGWRDPIEETGRTRFEQCVHNIEEIRPDVLAVQECAPGIFDALKLTLRKQGAYAEHWRGNAQNPLQKTGEGVGILYDPLRYERLGVSSQVFRSEQEESIKDRASIWIDLRDITTGKIIRFATAHLFGGEQREVGELQLNTLREDLARGRTPNQKYEVDATVIAADLNGTHLAVDHNMNMPDPRVLSCFQEYLCDGSEIPTEPNTDRRIDYILAKAEGSQITSLEPVATDRLPQASDHHMSASRLILGEKVQILSPVQSPEEGLQSILNSLACRIYDFVFDQKIPIAFGLLGLIFGGVGIAFVASLGTYLAQHTISWCESSNEEALR